MYAWTAKQTFCRKSMKARKTRSTLTKQTRLGLFRTSKISDKNTSKMKNCWKRNHGKADSGVTTNFRCENWIARVAHGTLLTQPTNSTLCDKVLFRERGKCLFSSGLPRARSRRLGICSNTTSSRTLRILVSRGAKRWTTNRWFLPKRVEEMAKTLQMEFDSPMLLQLRAEWLGNVASRIIYQGMPGRFQPKLHAPHVHHCPLVIHVHSVAFPCAGSFVPIVFFSCYILARTLCRDQKPDLFLIRMACKSRFALHPPRLFFREPWCGFRWKSSNIPLEKFLSDFSALTVRGFVPVPLDQPIRGGLGRVLCGSPDRILRAAVFGTRQDCDQSRNLPGTARIAIHRLFHCDFRRAHMALHFRQNPSLWYNIWLCGPALTYDFTLQHSKVNIKVHHSLLIKSNGPQRICNL